MSDHEGPQQNPAAESDAQPPLEKVAERKYHRKIVHNDQTYNIGDSAYVILQPDADQDASEDFEVCEICERTQKRKGRREIPLLECEQCLRGYHLDCLDPPLPAVPKVPTDGAESFQS